MCVRKPDEFRVDPSMYLCPIYDHTGYVMYPTANYDEMGFIVVDDFPREHIQ